MSNKNYYEIRKQKAEADPAFKEELKIKNREAQKRYREKHKNTEKYKEYRRFYEKQKYLKNKNNPAYIQRNREAQKRYYKRKQDKKCSEE